MKKIIEFFRGSREELQKVSWPSRDDVSRYTVVTVITLFIFAVFLYGVDAILFILIKLVMQ